MSNNYRIVRGSIHDQFLQSKAKIQIFGGGFANGKTAVTCVKVLQHAKDYPGANMLVARATYPKLQDTIMQEFLKWCPPSWIESFPTGQNKPTTCVLKNKTRINFRYIAQQGKSAEATTSNLLSATYDLIAVDQMEDPEIVYKDFLDLLGRLRGSATYVGNDETMPTTGPRQFIMTCNPTRNWVYKRLVKPLHDYQKTGRVSEDLLIDDKTGKPIIELFEGSTYANKENLSADFIRTLEIAYTGQMAERFLLGQWGAYEGLIYSDYDPTVHQVSRTAMMDYYFDLITQGIRPEWGEAYDYGMANPACYLLYFTDHKGRVCFVDGFYKKEMKIEDQIDKIREIRIKYSIPSFHMGTRRKIIADPAVFRRAPSDKKKVGTTVAKIFDDNSQGLAMRPANNDVAAGLNRVSSYLTVQRGVINPFTGDIESPFVFFAQELDFVDDEIVNYMWKKNTDGTPTEEPVKKNDHSMDTIRYALIEKPPIAQIVPMATIYDSPLMHWNELPETVEIKRRSYGRS